MRSLKTFSSRNKLVIIISRNRSSESAKYETNSTKPLETTVNTREVEHHSKFCNKWWDSKGELGPLHALNLLRVQLIRDGLANTGIISKENSPLPLKGTKILDVGCGGGILAEPLTRIGAEVTGIDASEELIETAKEHAKLDPSLSGRLNYVQTSIESFVENNIAKYDAVIASEVVEHVNDQETFLKCCTDTIKPGGSLFATTLNKTLFSWVGGIIIAEYLLKLVPYGTHNWNKFISPIEMQRILENYNCKTKLVHGMFYNPLKHQWSWITSTQLNYALHAVKLSN